MSSAFGTGLALASSALVALAGAAGALDAPEALGFERMPPRLSFTDGEVSFLRIGAEDWTPAHVNTALAAGDELYAADDANLELQVGPRAFVRAGEETQLGLTGLEPDDLQLRLITGTVSLDLRSVSAGQTFELDTPNAAFRIERSGYYRAEVDGDTTTFTSRRGGRASVTPAAGDPVLVAASEQLVVSGSGAPRLESYAAPELDAWDRWNHARTDDQLDAMSARYVPAEVYGAYELDRYGYWRIVPSYGAVWVPHHVGVGWVPYSVGRWMWDPGYGWTWVDDSPWGWAPFHYGRWVYVSGYWSWCPGPLVVRPPYYAPALVAFYGRGPSYGSIGRPYVGWVALGWGEPLIPWWGPAHFRRHAHWAGWGGPRVVNRAVVKHGTVPAAEDIRLYRNAGVAGAIVEVERDRFGRRSAESAPFTRARAERLSPLAGRMDVGPDRTSLVADGRRAKRPPHEPRGVTQRAPFGRQSETLRSAPPPGFERPRAGGAARRGTPPTPGRGELETLRGGARVRGERPRAPLGSGERSGPALRPAPALPGEPANRVFRVPRTERPGVTPPDHAPAPGALGTGRPGGGVPRGRPPGR
jgi:hypothetical protein